MAVGYVIYSAAAVGLLWWARRAALPDRDHLDGRAPVTVDS